MAALAQVAPVEIAAGQGAPGQQDAQVQADCLEVIGRQQVEIRGLQQRIFQGQREQIQDAQEYENRLDAMSRDKQALADQHAAALLLLRQRENALEELQRRREQDAEQIAIGLREIALLAGQVQQERERVQLLSGQLDIATRQIEQLTGQVDQLRQMHLETLAAIRQQPKQETSVIQSIWDMVVRGFRGHPVEDYTNM